MTSKNYVLIYYQQIKDGSVTVGKWIEKWYEYIVHGLEAKLFFFDQKKAARAIAFIQQYCRHHEGPLAPQLIQLEVWQKALISVIFGVMDKNGLRQFREVFVVMGRKNGKTLLDAAVACYMMIADGEYGARAFFVASKLAQARLAFEAFYQMIAKDPRLERLARKRRTDVYFEESNSSAMPVAFSEKKTDGLNPSFVSLDELASWRGDAGLKQYEVFKSALGARSQPMMFGISTAGYEPDGIYDELIKRSTGILNGTSQETRLAPFLYIIDDPEKWNDIDELRKANPNLGVSTSVDYMLEEIRIAEGSLSKKKEFLTKYCNVKQNASMAWMDTQTIRKSFNLGHSEEELREIYADKPWHLRMLEAGKIGPDGNRLDLDDFTRCYGLVGIDLSQTTDLTAVSLLVQREGIIYYFVKFFLPAEKLEEATARDGIPYQKYVEQGHLILSGENYVDYADCYRWVVDLFKKHKIYVQAVGLDRYCAQYLQKDLEATGLKCDTVFQGTNLTGIIMTTEGMMKDGSIQCANDNNLMKIHWLDAAIGIIGARNLRRLDKIKKNAHVDGVAAILDAMCMRANVWDLYSRRLENPDRGG
jgi:phage terminase large subunit-like protein